MLWGGWKGWGRARKVGPKGGRGNETEGERESVDGDMTGRAVNGGGDIMVRWWQGRRMRLFGWIEYERQFVGLWVA